MSLGHLTLNTVFVEFYQGIQLHFVKTPKLIPSSLTTYIWINHYHFNVETTLSVKSLIAVNAPYDLTVVAISNSFSFQPIHLMSSSKIANSSYWFVNYFAQHDWSICNRNFSTSLV